MTNSIKLSKAQCDLDVLKCKDVSLTDLISNGILHYKYYEISPFLDYIRAMCSVFFGLGMFTSFIGLSGVGVIIIGGGIICSSVFIMKLISKMVPKEF